MNEADWIARTVLSGLSLGAIGLIWFFVRKYFNGIDEKFQELKKSDHGSTDRLSVISDNVIKLGEKMDANGKDVARLEGSISMLQSEIRTNTEAMIKHRAELNALWRYADNQNRRASDG